MKVKEVIYVTDLFLSDLTKKVNEKLAEGWHVNGAISVDDEGLNIQMMFMPVHIKEIKTTVEKESVTFDVEITKLFAEGYTLYGTPFTVDGKLCQSMVRG